MNPKPWYWPVTTTVYKLILGFILTTGVYHLLGYFQVFGYLQNINGPTKGGLALAGAYLLYISLWKRDWL